MLCDETVLSFADAAKALPLINGKRVHCSTLWRWGRKGISGVRLEVRRLGGRYVTSIEALDRFSLELANVKLPGHRPTPPPKHPTDRHREKSIEQAEGTLRTAGIL